MRLAIVIPTLNEARVLSGTLNEARRWTDELVVADGGSTDETVAIAYRAGAEVVPSPPGRGTQLNRGARAALARGADALLFLHADSQLPNGARQEVETALCAGSVGGGFLMRFQPSSLPLRLGCRLVNARTRIFKVPLGDQAQFADGRVFKEVGGFPDWPILEDVELLRRLRRRGALHIVPLPVTTDARRFIQRGIVRTVATNWLIWSLYLLGAKPARLARLYRQVR